MKRIQTYLLALAVVLCAFMGAGVRAAWAEPANAVGVTEAELASATGVAGIDVAAKIAELEAVGGDASEVLASGLTSQEEAEAYLDGLTEAQSCHIMIDVEMQGDGTIIYGVTAYASQLWTPDEASGEAEDGVATESLDEEAGAEATADDAVNDDANSSDEELALEAASLQSTLENAWANLAKSVNVARFKILDANHARAYYEAVAQAPEYFNVRTAFGISVNKSTGYVMLYEPRYLTTDKTKYASMQKAYEARVAEAVSTICSTDTTDLAKVYLLHDWICNNVSYNNAAAQSSGAGKYPNAFTSYGAMVDGSAVCQGYSLALCDLLERAGITNKVLFVTTANHAWNMVVVDDNWYHVDSTWDDQSGYISRTWFMKSDAAIKTTDSTHQNWSSSSNYNWTSDMVASSTAYDSYDWSSFKAGHTWSEWTTTKTATYKEAGSKTRTCSVCGANETQAIAKLASQTMYRLYNPNSGEHFYTSSTEERDNLKRVGWSYEGVGWTAPTSATSSTPVYRLYNKNGGEHHFTTSKTERDGLIKLGWNDEGIGWYSAETISGNTRTPFSGAAPLYRQYNPNAYANNHNYTTSKTENDWLVSLGWRAEGIGWYGIS